MGGHLHGQSHRAGQAEAHPREITGGAPPRSAAIARIDQAAFNPAEISHRSPAVNIRRTTDPPSPSLIGAC